MYEHFAAFEDIKEDKALKWTPNEQNGLKNWSATSPSSSYIRCT